MISREQFEEAITNKKEYQIQRISRKSFILFSISKDEKLHDFVNRIFDALRDTIDSVSFISVSLLYEDWRLALEMLCKASQVPGDWKEEFDFKHFLKLQTEAHEKRENSGLSHDIKYLAFDLDFCKIAPPPSKGPYII